MRCCYNCRHMLVWTMKIGGARVGSVYTCLNEKKSGRRYIEDPRREVCDHFEEGRTILELVISL